jgi:hypothetical protein
LIQAAASDRNRVEGRAGLPPTSADPQALLDMPDYRAILRLGQPTEPVPIALRDLPPVTDSHAE